MDLTFPTLEALYIQHLMLICTLQVYVRVKQFHVFRQKLKLWESLGLLTQILVHIMFIDMYASRDLNRVRTLSIIYIILDLVSNKLHSVEVACSFS